MPECHPRSARAANPVLTALLAREQALAEGERVHAIKAKGKRQKPKGKGQKNVADRQDLGERLLVYAARIVKLVSCASHATGSACLRCR